MKDIVEKHPNKIASLVGLVAITLVYLRLMPTLPTVMQDELVYMIQSRHTNPEDVRFPNYFFNWLFSVTNLLGGEFYNFVKLLNFIFLFGFGAITYLISRTFFGLWVSIGIGLATLAGPASLYGTVFMPEAMYFFFAALTFYLAMKVPAGAIKSNWNWLLLVSLSLGLTSLIKPHALFLSLGFVLFFVLSSKWRIESFINRLIVSAVFVIVSIGTKLLFGFLFAGPNGLTLFGGYGSLEALFERFLNVTGLAGANTSSQSEVTSGSPGEADMPGFAELVLQQFGLHFTAIGFLLAPAWYVFFATKFSAKSALAELSLFLLGTMMLVSSAFGALVTVAGDDHTDRILLRYYEFLIPLVYLGVYQVLKVRQPDGVAKYVFFGVFSVSTIAIAANGAIGVDLILADSSYFLGIFSNDDIRWLYAMAMLVVFFMILGSPDKLAVYVALVISLATLFVGFSSQQTQLERNSFPIGSDFAGKYVRDELGDIPGDEIFIVGSDKQLVQASIFWMDRPGIDFELFTPGSVLPETLIPEGKTVIVQILGVRLENLEEGDLVEADWIISYR